MVLAFRLYAEQGLGCPEIAQRLNGMGYLPRRGGAFSRSTVGAMLQNPVYAGRVVRRGAVEINAQGLHPPLVSPALFEAAARRRLGRAHAPTAPRTQQNPLAGLVLCGCCGRKMQRLPPSPTRRQETLACPQAGCNRAVKLSLVEQAVRGVLLHHLPSAVTPRVPPPPSTAGRQREVARQEERLYQLLEQGVYTPDEFRRRRQVLARQKAALAAAAAEPEPPAPIPTADAYDDASPAARNRLLKAVFEKIVYYKSPDSLPENFELELYLRA